MMVDAALLTDFAHSFYGYGNLNAPIWFVGLEEASDEGEAELVARLEQWEKLGRPTTADVRAFGSHPELTGRFRWFEGETPPLHPTWSKLIRLQLARLERPSMIDDVRQYQRDELGAGSSEDCLLQLLTLPSLANSDWTDEALGDATWFTGRDAYTQHVLAHRLDGLRQLVDTHRPRFIVYYGLEHLEHWESIAGESFPAPSGYALELITQHTRHLAVPHPTAFAAKNTLFQRIGMTLR